MSVPVLTFFNNKGGVGKTSLVYHLSWMFAGMGKRVLACDFDPQANLTAAFLDEDRLAELWIEGETSSPNTIYRCVQPLTAVADLKAPELETMSANLALLPGDLALSGFEDQLSGEWSPSLGSTNLYRPFRVLTALWQVAQLGAQQHSAELILVDVGPNLGAINRSALIGSDFVVVPLGADLYSLQGLRNLGPTLRRWRSDWAKRLQNWSPPEFGLPQGRMDAIGYIVQQHSLRLSRPVKAYDQWVRQIPEEYHWTILEEWVDSSMSTANDPECLATLKHYRSLMPIGQEVRKPIFQLTVADGAIGSHALAVKEAYSDFRDLASAILTRMKSRAECER